MPTLKFSKESRHGNKDIKTPEVENYPRGDVFLVFDSEVVQEGFVVVLGGEAGVAEEFADVVPFAETTVVEHL